MSISTTSHESAKSHEPNPVTEYDRLYGENNDYRTNQNEVTQPTRDDLSGLQARVSEFKIESSNMIGGFPEGKISEGFLYNDESHENDEQRIIDFKKYLDSGDIPLIGKALIDALNAMPNDRRLELVEKFNEQEAGGYFFDFIKTHEYSILAEFKGNDASDSAESTENDEPIEEWETQEPKTALEAFAEERNVSVEEVEEMIKIPGITSEWKRFEAEYEEDTTEEIDSNDLTPERILDSEVERGIYVTSNQIDAFEKKLSQGKENGSDTARVKEILSLLELRLEVLQRIKADRQNEEPNEFGVEEVVNVFNLKDGQEEIFPKLTSKQQKAVFRINGYDDLVRMNIDMKIDSPQMDLAILENGEVELGKYGKYIIAKDGKVSMITVEGEKELTIDIEIEELEKVLGTSPLDIDGQTSNENKKEQPFQISEKDSQFLAELGIGITDSEVNLPEGWSFVDWQVKEEGKTRDLPPTTYKIDLLNTEKDFVNMQVWYSKGYEKGWSQHLTMSNRVHNPNDISEQIEKKFADLEEVEESTQANRPKTILAMKEAENNFAETKAAFSRHLNSEENSDSDMDIDIPNEPSYLTINGESLQVPVGVVHTYHKGSNGEIKAITMESGKTYTLQELRDYNQKPETDDFGNEIVTIDESSESPKIAELNEKIEKVEREIQLFMHATAEDLIRTKYPSLTLIKGDNKPIEYTPAEQEALKKTPIKMEVDGVEIEVNPILLACQDEMDKIVKSNNIIPIWKVVDADTISFEGTNTQLNIYKNQLSKLQPEEEEYTIDIDEDDIPVTDGPDDHSDPNYSQTAYASPASDSDTMTPRAMAEAGINGTHSWNGNVAHIDNNGSNTVIGNGIAGGVQIS